MWISVNLFWKADGCVFAYFCGRQIFFLFCTGMTNPSFCQIKIRTKMISHINISFFLLFLFLLTYIICFFWATIKDIHKKQKICALDILESLNKEMWLASYATCVEIITQVSLTWWSMFLVLDVLTMKLRTVFILLTNQCQIILLTAHTTKH